MKSNFRKFFPRNMLFGMLSYILIILGGLFLSMNLQDGEEITAFYLLVLLLIFISFIANFIFFMISVINLFNKKLSVVNLISFCFFLLLWIPLLHYFLLGS